jgi:hypothetical protein
VLATAAQLASAGVTSGPTSRQRHAAEELLAGLSLTSGHDLRLRRRTRCDRRRGRGRSVALACVVAGLLRCRADKRAA